MSDRRDTQFQGFAQLLLDEITSLPLVFLQTDGIGDGPSRDDIARLIAQRAYDLVSHTIDHTNEMTLYAIDQEDAVNDIPDMTEWPKEEASDE